GVDSGKAADAAKGAQASFLHHVLGVGAIAGEPARERVGVGEMRQHHAGEARLIVLAVQASHRRCAPLRSYGGRSATRWFYSRDSNGFRCRSVVPPAAVSKAYAAYHAAHSAACMSASMKPPDWRRHSAA